MSYFVYPFAAIGVVAVTLFAVGFWLDARDFDNTRGGYEAPYEGVTGDPVDWFALDRTPTGLVKRGHVIDVLIDATTGMISFDIFGLVIPFQPFSDRALVVHRPREALLAMGFAPEF